MKKLNKANLIVFAFSILIGIFIAIQLKQNVEYFAPVTLDSIQTMKNEINAINKEIEELNKMLEDKQAQIEMLESIASGDENIIDILKSELEKNKLVAGFKKVQGPGIIIRMEDNMSEDAFGQEHDLDIIHDTDVLRIINDLRAAGAEAISINEQRVLSTSEIKCGGPIIRINGRSVATPFYIKAIGDPKLLNAAVNAPNTYGYALRTIDQLNIETSIEDNIIIPEYRGIASFRYAKPIREGD
ncbi:DUF881 domain-containing protein [Tepidimicrobium xylanilyticum]|mgnify:CR=1 FL=1|uniref:Uncharacterized conserved protein YlxW, UPF0749 family n=1 Tax=Tepidimicrobium xylanilyticum TaxID=1123352 RepID=A0A1H2SPX5_9FIRM|nr:DUF881 domain-containing protein [Tepidimicrobium xylanilyticum]GMG96153.1 hypothetical protein EN5CB1_09790 [Tepidimicrobium xylanilyticum]SDW33662.1 Uncharacterized conserved protein YlxW, UPF0749 family [Tepidimicrobium xylanilyticum]